MDKSKIQESKFYNNISNLKDFFSLSDKEFTSNIYSEHSNSDKILHLKINLFGNQVLVNIYYNGHIPKITCLNNPELGNELDNAFRSEYYS
jgi:hypothetical protein